MIGRNRKLIRGWCRRWHFRRDTTSNWGAGALFWRALLLAALLLRCVELQPGRYALLSPDLIARHIEPFQKLENNQVFVLIADLPRQSPDQPKRLAQSEL